MERSISLLKSALVKCTLSGMVTVLVSLVESTALNALLFLLFSFLQAQKRIKIINVEYMNFILTVFFLVQIICLFLVLPIPPEIRVSYVSIQNQILLNCETKLRE